MHRKENDGGSERLTVSHHHREILERGEFDAAQAESLGRQSEDHSPEFLPGIGQGRDHDGSGGEGGTNVERDWIGDGGLLFHA